MMHNPNCLLASFFAGIFLSSTGILASIGIPFFPTFSDALNPPQLSIDSLHSRLAMTASPNAAESNRPLTLTSVDLSIKPTAPLDIYQDFAVGMNSLSSFHRVSDPILHIAPPSTRIAEQWDFIQHLVVGPDFWDAVGERFDVTDEERPWSDTTIVHVLAPTGNPVVPFATVAYEVDSIESYDRIGLGGGAQISLKKNITLGADLVYFGDRLNATTAHETRAMARLEIQF